MKDEIVNEIEGLGAELRKTCRDAERDTNNRLARDRIERWKDRTVAYLAASRQQWAGGLRRTPRARAEAGGKPRSSERPDRYRGELEALGADFACPRA